MIPKDSWKGNLIRKKSKNFAVRFPNVKCTMALKLKLGSALRKRGFVTRHRKTGNFYVVMPKLAA